MIMIPKTKEYMSTYVLSVSMTINRQCQITKVKATDSTVVTSQNRKNRIITNKERKFTMTKKHLLLPWSYPVLALAQAG